ncbi:hypothetical protein ACHAW6_002361 [Cyclotella cf. meneghiniana]
MTVTKEGAEPEITVDATLDQGEPLATAVGVETGVEKPDAGAAGGSNESPIPAGHSRFYCSKCRAPYDLPDGANSWRCAGCHTFNTTQPGECEWCSIL